MACYLNDVSLFLQENFSSNWINQLFPTFQDDNSINDQSEPNLESTIASKLDNAAIGLFEKLNYSVLSGEYVNDLLAFRQKLDSIINVVQAIGADLDIPSSPQTTLVAQGLFQSNFYYSVKETIKSYLGLLHFVEQHLIYKPNTSTLFNLISEDVNSPKENNSAAKQLSQLFDLNVNLAKIDHSLSFTKQYFSHLVLIKDGLQKSVENPAAEILKKKCDFLLYKISFRLRQSQKNYLYGIDFNYTTIPLDAVPEFSKYNNIINGHYENGLKSQPYEQRRYDALNKLKYNQQLVLDDFHALIKYFKDDEPNLNKLKRLRVFYKCYRDQHYANSSLYDQKAFDITFCYLENNILSLELEKKEFTLANWKSKLKEYTDQADNFQNKNFFPYYKIVKEFLSNEISSQFFAKDFNLKVVRELIDDYKENLSKLVENVGICEETDYLAFQNIYDNCKLSITDSTGANRDCFISSSFVLPINYKELREELEQNKAELNKFNSMYEIQRMIDADRRDVRTMKREIEKTDKRHIEILSIFAALVMFVSNEIQIFTKIPNMADAVAYTLFFAYGLGIFVLMIWFITRPEGFTWEKLTATHKFVMTFFVAGLMVAVFYVTRVKPSNSNKKQLDYLQFRIDSLKKAKTIDILVALPQKQTTDTNQTKPSKAGSLPN